MNLQGAKIMKIHTLKLVYFSPTGNSKKIVQTIAGDINIKRITKGEISLYRHEYTSQTGSVYNGAGTGTGFVGGGGSYEAETLYLVKEGIAYKVKKRNFHELLKELMIDDKELYADIDEINNRDLMFEYSLQKLISNYNLRRKQN